MAQLVPQIQYAFIPFLSLSYSKRHVIVDYLIHDHPELGEAVRVTEAVKEHVHALLALPVQS